MPPLSGKLLVFDPRDPASNAVKPYKIRRTHKKSRGGCLNCKQRRVKCDEIRPNCGSCKRRDLDCAYKGESNDVKHADRVRLITDQLDLSHKAFNPTAQQDYFNSQFLRMWPRLWPGKASPHVLANDPAAFTSRYDLPILHHLTEGTIGPSLFAESAPSFQIDVISIGLSHRHVMHALLAASALHIRFTRHPTLVTSNAIDPAPNTLLSCLTTPSGVDPFASIEAGHHLSASQLFRSSLVALQAIQHRSLTPAFVTTVTKDSDIDIDPLLTTCMLLNMLSFAGLPEASPATARWPFVPVPHDWPSTQRPLNWLRVQLGFGPLLTSLTAHMRETSQWLAFFMTLGHEVFYDDRKGTTDIPPDFCDLFNINPSSAAEDHPYLKLVRRLLAILRVWQSVEDAGGGGERHDEQVLRYFQFMQGVDEAFISRLEARDVRALVIYGWFMSILAGARHWWCRVRARREVGCVVRWLDCWSLEILEEQQSGIGGYIVGEDEGEELRRKVRTWLPFMARPIGYELMREKEGDRPLMMA